MFPRAIPKKIQKLPQTKKHGRGEGRGRNDGAGTQASRDEHLQVLGEVRWSGRCGVTEFIIYSDFENRFGFGKINAPVFDLLGLNANASGTPKGRAKDFLAGIQGILARKRAKFCFGGGGSKSEAILTFIFASQKNIKRIFV